MQTLFAASVLHADFKKLPEQLRILDVNGINRYHFDIMDGHFVPNFGISPAIMASINHLTELPFEAHLMIEHPEQFISMIAQAGAASILVHAETMLQLRRVIGQIRKAGCRPGVALNPTTPPDALSYILPDVSSVLLLSADVGDTEHSAFSDTVLDKIREVRDLINDQRLAVEVMVEGGITQERIGPCVRAGADVIILGTSGLFSQPDLAAVIRAARQSALNARQMLA